MFPRAPNGQEFFNDDAVGFLTGVILYILDSAPEHRRNLGTMHEAVAAPLDQFKLVTKQMAASRVQAVREAANNALGKSGDRGLPDLRDTLHSKLSLRSDPALLAVTDNNDVDFAGLKDHPATVYITVPFNSMEPYAPFLKVLLKATLDAMLDNPVKPDPPVLFILDEFLSLGPFADFRNAIRTHASAGVRLWFFLQEYGDTRGALPRASLAGLPQHLSQTVLRGRRPVHCRAGRPVSRHPDRRIPQCPDRRQRLGANGGLVRGWFSRGQYVDGRVHSVPWATSANQREFWADATAAALLGPEPMIEALRRLDGDPIELPASKLAYARLLIRSHPREWLSTHPSIDDRIEALERGIYVKRLPFK